MCSGLILILLAFIPGNSSLEPLIEGLFAQIYFDLSWRVFGRNRTGDLRITQIFKFLRSSPLSYGDRCITEDLSGPSKTCMCRHLLLIIIDVFVIIWCPSFMCVPALFQNLVMAFFNMTYTPTHMQEYLWRSSDICFRSHTPTFRESKKWAERAG